MTLEPPLTVAGPVAAAGTAGAAVDLDGVLARVPALALSWDVSGACVAARLVGDDGAGAEAATATLSGSRWLDLVHPDERERAGHLVASVLAGDTTRDEGLRLQARNRWAVLRARRVTGVVGVGAEGVLVDATHALGDTARMARIVGSFNRLRRPDDIVQAVLDEAIALLDGTNAVVYVLSGGGDALEFAGAVGVPVDKLRTLFGAIPLGAALPATEVLRSTSIVAVRSEAERRERYPLLDTLDISFTPAFVVAPLFDGDDRPFGALAIGLQDERALDEPEQQFLRDVAAQCALALDRARLTSVAEHRQQRLTFLDALSESLSSSLELEGTLTRLAEMAVSELCDWAVVRLVSAAGDTHPLVGASHTDPRLVDELIRLAQKLPRSIDDFGEVGRSLLAGESVALGQDARDVLSDLLGRTEDAAIGAVGAGDVAIFPLTARGRLLGGLAFGNRRGRRFRAGDLELAELVATRAATLVDNARLFADRSGVARALQDSLLPSSLPRIPGLELGARYRAAGRGLDVGGDFYDAFRADANWWIVAVGDVCGHGVEAAALTGLVRHTIRASAMAGAMPSAILGRLNDMLLRHSVEQAGAWAGDVPYSPRFCTVVLGAVQPTAGGVDLILCLAGHPQPLVRRRNGTVMPVGSAGTLLGVTDKVSLTDTVVHLDEGEVLACFTDGLTDRRFGDRLFGEEGVVRALYGGDGLSAQQLAAHIENQAVAFVEDEPVDDMAVLTLAARQR